MDVMYKKPEEEEELSSEEAETETDAETEDEMSEAFHLEEFPSDALLPDISDTFHETVKNIRLIVKYFRCESNKYWPGH